MVLFSIPDIRLFWSQDERFLSQFRENEISTFKPYSKYPECYKDLAFWLPERGSVAAATVGKEWHENDFMEVVRDEAGDLVEGVQLVSQILVSIRADQSVRGATLYHGPVDWSAMSPAD